MNTITDRALLRRWQEEKDGLAFREIARRYGGVVFAAANRVLGNGADAEEVAQECFLKLAATKEPKESLGAWLHTLAVRAAIDRVRSETQRRKREAAFDAERPKTVSLELDDLLRHVDEAIAALPADYRDCIVGHFLRDVEQAQLATELGISRWTVRRRVKDGIRRVRDELAKKGVSVGAGALMATLGTLASEATPPTLSATLGKMAVGGIQSNAGVTARAVAGKSIQTAGGIIAMKKIILSGAILVAGLLGWWMASSKSQETVGPENSLATAHVDAPSGEGMAPRLEETSAGESGSPRPDGPRGLDIPPSNGQLPKFMMGAVPQPKPLTLPATVMGMVTDDRGRVVVRAEVTLYVAGFSTRFKDSWDEVTYHTGNQHIAAAWEQPGNQYRTVTDDDGTFTIGEVRHGGANALAVEATGYEMNRTAVALESGQVTEADVVLAPGVAIRGRVVTPSDAPITDATVFPFTLHKKDGGSRISMIGPHHTQSKTDRQGNFSMSVGGGPWVSAAFLVKSPTHGAQVFDALPVGDGPLTLTMEGPSGTLSGYITQSDGSGAGGRALLLRGTIRAAHEVDGETRYQKADWPLIWGATDADGAYRLEDVPTMAAYRAIIFDSTGRQEAEVPLAPLLPKTDNTWNYTLEPAIRVSGVVRGETSGKGLPQVYVCYKKFGETDDDWRIKGSVPTDASGAFEIELLSGPGTYSFSPVFGQNVFAAGGPGIELAPGDEEVLELTLPDPWTRRFQVLDQFGEPVPGAKVHISGGVASPPTQETDENGIAEVVTLDPRFAASARVELAGFLKHEGDWLMKAQVEDGPFESVVLYRLTSLTAQLVDEADAPLANRAVRCVAHFGARQEEELVGATNNEGWLLLDGTVPAGPVDLEISTDDDGATSYTGRLDSVDLAVEESNSLGALTLFADEAGK